MQLFAVVHTCMFVYSAVLFAMFLRCDCGVSEVQFLDVILVRNDHKYTGCGFDLSSGLMLIFQS